MNTYIEHKNLIPYLLELGWMIAKDTWTDCPQKVYDKLAKSLRQRFHAVNLIKE